MSWIASILVALLAAAIGLVLGGFIASHAVSWYRISSFEGGAGYFVVGMALLGFVAGFLIGLVATRVVAASAHPGVWRAIGWSQLIVIGVAAIVAGIARFSADVAPKLNGEELLLQVELRWPATQTTSPATDTTPRRLKLYASHDHVARARRDGALWMEDAHQVDGRWVVPGAVAVWTSRGDRVLMVEPAFDGMHAFLVPLPAWPKNAQLEWSEWMPRAREGAPALPDGFRMRFRVLPRSQPVRAQTFGPWQIATVADGFYDYYRGGQPSALAASARFFIRYRGTPVTIDWKSDDATESARFDRFASVALLPGAPDALFVHAATEDDEGPLYLLVADGERVKSELVAESQPLDAGTLLTNDVAAFRRAKEADMVPGIIDRTTYAHPGEYLFQESVLSTQPPAVHHFTPSANATIDVNVPPLGVSPDGRRFVRFGWNEENVRVLIVTDVTTGERTIVPVDLARMRFSTVGLLDPAWLAHYWMWTRGNNGEYELEPRSGVAPLPWKGLLTPPGHSTPEYQVGPAGEALFEAMASFLTTEMGATRTPEDQAASGWQAHLDGTVLFLFDNTSEHHVTIWLDQGGDQKILARIAERFDAALATGKYDALFTPDVER
ncbi:MAG: hypothetical protein JF589_14600 [Gemmatimonadetes bacterium]|nr:hypothetical protein [Gemmatimonadota bacterium]